MGFVKSIPAWWRLSAQAYVGINLSVGQMAHLERKAGERSRFAFVAPELTLLWKFLETKAFLTGMNNSLTDYYDLYLLLRKMMSDWLDSM